jgi:hypothetical protein
VQEPWIQRRRVWELLEFQSGDELLLKPQCLIEDTSG